MKPTCVYIYSMEFLILLICVRRITYIENLDILNFFLPKQFGLTVISVHLADTTLTVALIATSPTAACPLCGQLAGKLHSEYRRTLTDLAWAGKSVSLVLHVRRFFCLNSQCSRRIFCERLDQLTLTYARKTKRLLQALENLALALGGRPAAALAKREGLATSRVSLLRLLYRYKLPAFPSPRLLGVDDFALKKGRTYGTLLVDLESHQPIEVLADRTDKTFGEWLQQHPTVEVISRDRDSSYAKAARQFAPQARQVADRFHIVANLREYVGDFCQSKKVWQLLSKNQTNENGVTADDIGTIANLPALAPTNLSSNQAQIERVAPSTKESRRQQARFEQRLARFEQVRALAEKGYTNPQIVAELKLNRATVSRYLAAADAQEAVGSKPRTKMASLLDPYKGYIYERWRKEQPTITTLYEEIKQQGYTGSPALIRNFLARLRPKAGWSARRGKVPQLLNPEEVASLAVKTAPKLSSRTASWLIFKQPADKVALRAEQAQQLAQLRQADSQIETMYQLVQEFRDIVRDRTSDKLEAWLKKARASDIAELESFSNGIDLDRKAVEAGLSLEYSNGQLEGQVNRVKNIKRAMYGRANFELLRIRVLAA